MSGYDELLDFCKKRGVSLFVDYLECSDEFDVEFVSPGKCENYSIKHCKYLNDALVYYKRFLRCEE